MLALLCLSSLAYATGFKLAMAVASLQIQMSSLQMVQLTLEAGLQIFHTSESDDLTNLAGWVSLAS